jgi:hypothetical protein
MANYSFALWIVLSAGLLLLFVYAAWINLRRRHLPDVGLDEVVPYLLPVDLEALLAAMNPSQDAYLRHCHTPREFRRLQDKRFRLAAEYLRRMSHNAALLQRIGYSQIHSSNSLVAAQAQELIDAGVHVRLYAFVGMAAIYFRWAMGMRPFPFVSLPKLSDIQKLMSAALIPSYESLRNTAESLTALRDIGLREVLVQGM